MKLSEKLRIGNVFFVGFEVRAAYDAHGAFDWFLVLTITLLNLFSFFANDNREARDANE